MIPKASPRETMLSQMAPQGTAASPSKKPAMTYHLSADELATLNQTGKVDSSSGCTITADIAGNEESGEPADNSELAGA